MESLLDIKQTAAYLKMNKMTIYKLAREGKIPAFKVASEWRFKKELIDKWLMSQLKGTGDFKDSTTAAEGLQKKTLLVVDDEKVIQDYFERVLSDYRVIKASSGEEALSIIQEEKPDLVLLDIRMPGIDGIETLRRIKGIDKDIIVIMLSAFNDLQTNIEAAKLGAFTSLSKPFDLDEMRKILSNASVSK